MKFPEQFRRANAHHGYSSTPGDPFGVFHVPGHKANGRALNIIACDGLETQWEHVSVSLTGQPQKCPSWTEMCIVKRLFWDDAECVVQFHPPESDYVNNHPGTLHLWRSINGFPQPPIVCV
jgi:hypothetical protein